MSDDNKPLLQLLKANKRNKWPVMRPGQRWELPEQARFAVAVEVYGDYIRPYREHIAEFVRTRTPDQVMSYGQKYVELLHSLFTLRSGKFSAVALAVNDAVACEDLRRRQRKLASTVNQSSKMLLPDFLAPSEAKDFAATLETLQLFPKEVIDAYKKRKEAQAEEVQKTLQQIESGAIEDEKLVINEQRAALLPLEVQLALHKSAPRKCHQNKVFIPPGGIAAAMKEESYPPEERDPKDNRSKKERKKKKSTAAPTAATANEEKVTVKKKRYYRRRWPGEAWRSSRHEEEEEPSVAARVLERSATTRKRKSTPVHQSSSSNEDSDSDGVAVVTVVHADDMKEQKKKTNNNKRQKTDVVVEPMTDDHRDDKSPQQQQPATTSQAAVIPLLPKLPPLQMTQQQQQPPQQPAVCAQTVMPQVPPLPMMQQQPPPPPRQQLPASTMRLLAAFQKLAQTNYKLEIEDDQMFKPSCGSVIDYSSFVSNYNPVVCARVDQWIRT